MTRYLNRSGQSSVVGYELEDSSIKVQFSDGSVYLYTNSSTGSFNIAKMKSLAAAGMGLNSFISTTVKKGYAAKLR